MRYSNPLIAVTDMDKSLRFYKELFGLEVAMDLGWCKSLNCGLTLQEHFDVIAGFPAESMKFKPNTMELYFETEDFDGFVALLDARPDVERLHDPKTYPWQQRGIHIYDPDGHLIEVSEEMYAVGRRLFAQGKSVSETAAATQFPISEAELWHERYLAENKSL